MKQSDIDHIKRYRKAFPKTILSDEQIITVLDFQKREKRKIDNYFNKRSFKEI